MDHGESMSSGLIGTNRWRLPLRLARRESRRRPGRTVLVALLIAIPVMAMTIGSIVARSNVDNTAWDFRREYGAVDIAVQSPQRDAAGEARVDAALPADATATHLRLGFYLPVTKQGDTRLVSAQLVGLPQPPPPSLTAWGVERGDVPAAGEVWVSRHLLDRYQLDVGDTLELQNPTGSWTVSGTGEPPSDHDRDVLVFGRLPVEQFRRQALHPLTLIDLPGDDPRLRSEVVGRLSRFTPANAIDTVERREQDDSGETATPQLAWGWVAGVISLGALGIIISAAFATSARRQLVTVGQLSANGASPRIIGSSLALQGLWTGIVGVVAGTSAGVALGVFGRPLERFSGNELPPTKIVPADLAVIAVTGVAAAIAAAYLPARTAARVPTLTALGGRRPVGTVPVRLVPIGLGSFAVGVLALSLAAGSNSAGHGVAAAAVLGGVLVMVAACCCSPLAIDTMSAAAATVGRTWRFAGRSLGRTRARSAAIVTAIGVTGAIALAGSSWALGNVSGDEEPRSFPGDAVMIEPSRMEAAPDGGSSRPDVQVPVELRQALSEIFSGADWQVRREAVFSGPGGSETRMGRNRLRVAADAPIVVADQPAVELYELSGADREALVDTGALVLNDWYAPSPRAVAGPGVEPLPATVDVRLRTVDGDVTFTAARRQHLLAPEATAGGSPEYDPGVIRGRDLLMITEELATSVGLDIVQRGAFVRTGERISRDQQQQLDALASSFSGFGALSSTYRNVPAAADAPFWHLDWERVNWEPSSEAVQLTVAAAATLLVLVVVAIGLSLAATESRDERDVLVAVGAKPATMRRMAGVKAIVLTVTGGLIAVPTGLVPMWAVTRAAETTFVIPSMQVGLLLVAVPLIAGVAAWTASSIAQRARPVQMSNLAID